MNKTLITMVTMTLLLATPALAIDFGNGLSLENTIHLEYSKEASSFDASYYEAELGYAVNDSLNLYADTTIALGNLKELNFSGVNLGVEFAPPTELDLLINVEAQFDQDLQYSDVVIYAELEF